jgi:UDP-3-O-[3-hydroxymyristoyl] N-acetylglucosamine deacetylase/3-hydroxyacyl-[acyl-carrier-protein] dehydratase
MTDYKVKSLGTQYTAMYSLEEDFVEQFAPARTYCLYSEIITLNNLGLIKGGSMDNAVVFVDKIFEEKEVKNLKKLFNLKDDFFIGDNGILNGTKLRFNNEPIQTQRLMTWLGNLLLKICLFAL